MYVFLLIGKPKKTDKRKRREKMSGTAETSEVWMKGPPRQPPNYFLAIQITEEEASIEYLFRPYPC